MEFRVFTAGWEPSFIDDLLTPIEERAEVSFTHGLVGDASRIQFVQKRYPGRKFIALSKAKEDDLPPPDCALLAGLESTGVPTVRSMVQGDRVLRYRSEREALGYATLLAGRMQDALREYQPDVVLGSFDSLHAGISLAVAKSLGIPWVALAFPVIPDNLTGFCHSMTPDSLVPVGRPVDERLRTSARDLIQNVRARQQKVIAYRAPASMTQWARQYLVHGRNILRRRQAAEVLGIDRFTYPSISERTYDIARRSFNRIALPIGQMVSAPPEGRFIYYPLHMAPESMLDTWAPLYQNQLAFVAQLSLAIPADATFVVKLHFSDPDNYSRSQLQQLMKLPRLKIANPNAPGRDFLEKATLVIGIQGTSCLEAALLGKPVLIFGDSPYQHFPRTERAERPDKLQEQIRRMLDLSPAGDDEIVEAYASYLARYMPGRINDWSRAIEPDALNQFAECFRALRSHIGSSTNREDWYKRPPFSSRRPV